jgi:tetratricopeptide (TPR) repeat protein
MRFAAVALAASCLAAPVWAAEEIPVTSKSPEARELTKRAQVAIDNVHIAEAVAALKKAIELDPDLATAHAILATLSPPAEGKKEIELAQRNLSSLPEAERVRIEGMAAGIAGDNAKARELQTKLVELAPGDFRAHMAVGTTALGDRDFAKAQAEFEKAIELNPQASGAYNLLGYTYAGQNQYDKATATFRKYAEVVPDEPNAHDSLAETLLNGGHLAEAEAEFQKALALNPKFAQAWTGIAQTRLMRGDFRGADDALQREKKIDDRPVAVLNAEINVAVAKLIEGKADECWKKLDEVVAKGTKLGTGHRYGTPGFKARLMVREGKAAAAEKIVQSDLAETRKGDLPEGFRTGIQRFLLGEQVRASAYAGHADPAAKALLQLEEASKSVAQVAFNASLQKNARGLVALAKGDAKAGAEEMRGCTDVDFNCQYDLVRAQEKAGDTQGAAATRESFFRVPRRGIEYVYLWKKLGGRPAARVAAKPQGE